jgi:hypothetical protein
MEGKKTEKTDWISTNIEPDYQQGFDGKPVQKYRKATATIPVKGIPMISEACVTKHFMVTQLTDTVLRLKVIAKTSGVPNGDKV